MTLLTVNSLPQSVLPMEKSWLSVLQATKEDVDDAVREAWKAFETWKKVPTSERAAILNKSQTSSTQIQSTWLW